jgi:hypothetical protein
MHIAICRVLEPYGYEFSYFEKKMAALFRYSNLPPLKAGKQSLLMKEAIVNYMLESEIIQ